MNRTGLNAVITKVNLLTHLLVGALLMLLAASAAAQITPSDDAYTLTSSPTKNFGTATTLEVESSGATTFVRFDLSGIPSSVTGSMVAKGTLKIFVGTVATAGSFNVDLVTSSWSEKTITANSEPTLGSAIASAIPVITSDKDQYILIDVTAAVVDWLNGTANDGIALVPDGTVSFALNSKETTTTSHPAELDIVLTGPQGPQGPPGPISGVTAGPGLTGGGTKGNVTVSMLTNCASGQVLQWNGSTWACSSAGTGTVTGVTAGTDLTGGGTGGTVTLNLDTSKIPQLTASNTFTAYQSITGNSSNSILNVTQNATSGSGFGVVSTSYNNNRGLAAILGQEMATSSAGVFGVEGFIGSLNGAGVYGQDSNPQSSVGNATAVSAGVWGDSGGGTTGVLGTSTNYSGVVGFNNSTASPTIFGENQNTTNSSSALVPGIFGLSFGPRGMAVVGSGPIHSNTFTNYAGQNAYGVVGDAGPANNIGVFGSADSGTGVFGASTSSGTGVYALSETGTGIQGTSISGTGIYGSTNFSGSGELQFGVWGDDLGSYGESGVYGSSANGVGVTGHGSFGGVYGQSTGTGYGGFFASPQGGYPLYAYGKPGTYCTVDDNGNLACSGSKSAVVPVSNDRWVRLYAVESPENWFEDFGSGQLSNGSAEIALEPTFAETVNAGMDYRVFPVPNADCKGLYVASKTSTTFVVRELGGGTSNVAFDYRIVARRKGYENVRMEDFTEKRARGLAYGERLGKMVRPHPSAALGAAKRMPSHPQVQVLRSQP